LLALGGLSPFNKLIAALRYKPVTCVNSSNILPLSSLEDREYLLRSACVCSMMLRRVTLTSFGNTVFEAGVPLSVIIIMTRYGHLTNPTSRRYSIVEFNNECCRDRRRGARSPTTRETISEGWSLEPSLLLFVSAALNALICLAVPAYQANCAGLLPRELSHLGVESLVRQTSVS
jgi:hypothetical protein